MRKNTGFRLDDETLEILDKTGGRSRYLENLIKFRHERAVLALSKLYKEGWKPEDLLKICRESAGHWRHQGNSDQRIDTVVSEYWLGNSVVKESLEDSNV